MLLCSSHEILLVWNIINGFGYKISGTDLEVDNYDRYLRVVVDRVFKVYDNTTMGVSRWAELQGC